PDALLLLSHHLRLIGQRTAGAGLARIHDARRIAGVKLHLSPFQVLLVSAVWARQVEPHETLGLGSGLADLAGVGDLGRGSANRFRKHGSLNTLVAEEGRTTLLLNVRVKRGQLVVVDAIDRLFPVVFRGRAT